jgi:hypothetical protein
MKKAFLFISLFVCYFQTQAQTSQFMMSTFGALPGTASNGSAIQFNSITACIDVQTGIAVMNGPRGNGQFAINCEVTMKINSLGVRLFPNPVNHFAKIKLNNTPPLAENFNLSIWTAEGMLIRTQKETGYNLFQGLTIDLSGLTNGTYILKIESPAYVDAIKFIKAN